MSSNQHGEAPSGRADKEGSGGLTDEQFGDVVAEFSANPYRWYYDAGKDTERARAQQPRLAPHEFARVWDIVAELVDLEEIYPPPSWSSVFLNGKHSDETS